MTFALLIALGVRVVPVHRLGPDAQYLPSLRLLLVDADLDNDRADRVTDRVLPALFDEVAVDHPRVQAD